MKSRLFELGKRFFTKLVRPNPNPFKLRNGHRVEVAFTHDGVDYYQFAKAIDTPYDRALFAHLFYRELSMGVDREDLLQFFNATDQILSAPKGKVNLANLYRLQTNMKERINFIVDPDLLLKLASVVYFDKNEDPYTYDMAYGQVKINKWKKDKKHLAFFLSLPITDVLPFLKQSGIDIETYSMVVEKLKGRHSEFLTSILSVNTTRKENTSVSN